MHLHEALSQHLSGAGTSIGTRFYAGRMPQNVDGQLQAGTKFPSAYFDVSLDPEHTHDENDSGTVRIVTADIEITVVGRGGDGVSGSRQALRAAREVVEAMRTFSGRRQGLDDDGVPWSTTVGGTLLEQQDAPDWHAIQRSWEVDLRFTCKAT